MCHWLLSFPALNCWTRRLVSASTTFVGCDTCEFHWSLSRWSSLGAMASSGGESSGRGAARKSADRLVKRLITERDDLNGKCKGFQGELAAARLCGSDTHFAGTLTSAAREALEFLVPWFELAPRTRTLGSALGFQPVREKLNLLDPALLKTLGHIGDGAGSSSTCFSAQWRTLYSGCDSSSPTCRLRPGLLRVPSFVEMSTLQVMRSVLTHRGLLALLALQLLRLRGKLLSPRPL